MDIEEMTDDEAWDELSYGLSETIQGELRTTPSRNFPVFEGIGRRLESRQPSPYNSLVVEKMSENTAQSPPPANAATGPGP